MTVSVLGSRQVYSGNGTTTSFSFPRLIMAATDLVVYLVHKTTMAATLKVYSSDYVVAGVGDPVGGSVVFSTAPSADHHVVIFGDIARTQNLDADTGPFSLTSLEASLDRLTVAVDETRMRADRSLHLKLTDTTALSAELPNIEGNRILGTDAAGQGFAWFTPDVAGSHVVQSRVELAASDTTVPYRYLAEGSRSGWFKWDASVLVATHQADTQQGIYVAPNAAANGAWVRQFSGPLQAEWFGAVADFAGGTGTDNTAAVQGAIAMALLLGGHEVRFGAGRFYFPSTTPLDPGAGGLAFIGMGRDATYLHFEEGTALSKRYLFKNISNTAKGGLTFRDLCFQGTLATSARRAGNPLWLDYYKRVNTDSCRFYSIAGEAMDFHYCSQFRCVDSDFEDIAADAIRARDCPDTMVSGNRIKRNGDDSIAIHVTPWSYSSFRPTRRRIDIHNNIVVNGGAIKVIGPKVTRITNNVLGLINQAHGIIVQDSSPEGGVAFHDIEISDNTINDVVDVSTGTAAQATAYISIAASAAMTPRGTTATNGTIPGDYDATGAAFIKPWDWYETDSTDATKAVPFPARIVVARNTLGRTLKAAAAFSDYGHGSALFQGVAHDPAVGDTTLFPTNGVWGGSYPGFVGLAINDNQIEDCEYGVGLPTATSDRGYRNCQVMRNRMLNIKNYGVICQGSSDIDMTIAHNVIDMDPYCRNANSNVNGSFAADGLPWGVSGGSAKGMRIFDNTFAHCCVPVKLNSPGSNHVDRNIIRCGTPAAVGFNVGNKGIGNIPVNDNWVYEISDADPTSGSYRQYTQKLLLFSATMPSTGWYPAGYFVQSTAAAQLGWMRLTTGSAHVLGTDWRAVPSAPYTTASNGDADAMLTTASARVQMFTTTLTANRTVTLPAAGLSDGDRFTVTRKAGGAYTLSIVAAAVTLTTLGINQSADLIYDGTAGAWALAGRSDMQVGRPVTVLGGSGTTVDNTGNTSENTVATVTVPANSLGANGFLRIFTFWETTGNTNNKTVKVKFGANAFTSVVINSATGLTHQFVTIIHNSGATNAQQGQQSNFAGIGANINGAPSTGTVDTTVDQTVTITAQCAVGTDHIYLRGYSVEACYLP